MRARIVLVAVALASVGACTDDGDGDGADGAADPSGCPVPPSAVEERLGFDVSVDSSSASATSCRFDAVDREEHQGARVVVMARELGEDEAGYGAALRAVEAEAGPVEPLDEGAVDGADRGWVASIGRVVQVGAARGDSLVQVLVADPELDTEAATGVALDLARDALR